MAIREWNWWRLYTKIIPLLDIHRTEEELKNKNVSAKAIISAFSNVTLPRRFTVIKIPFKNYYFMLHFSFSLS